MSHKSLDSLQIHPQNHWQPSHHDQKWAYQRHHGTCTSCIPSYKGVSASLRIYICNLARERTHNVIPALNSPGNERACMQRVQRCAVQRSRAIMLRERPFFISSLSLRRHHYMHRWGHTHSRVMTCAPSISMGRGTMRDWAIFFLSLLYVLVADPIVDTSLKDTLYVCKCIRFARAHCAIGIINASRGANLRGFSNVITSRRMMNAHCGPRRVWTRSVRMTGMWDRLGWQRLPRICWPCRG